MKGDADAHADGEADGEADADAGPDGQAVACKDPAVVTQIAAGDGFTCAVLASGGVRCWGYNQSGELGDGTTMSRPAPAPVDVLTGAKAIVAGLEHVCALLGSGDVRCWGYNNSGQVGDGTMVNRSTPSPVVLSGVGAIAAGWYHTCAVLQANGGVRCWGSNSEGQLGNGTVGGVSPVPGTADAITGAKDVLAANHHSCALLDSGGVRCWGLNINGVLGDPTVTSRYSPGDTDVITGAQALSAFHMSSCALLEGDTISCWGLNSYGQLGDGTTVDRLAPMPVPLPNVAAVSAGFWHTCALVGGGGVRVGGGGVRCWGYNASGQLGDGTTMDRASPPATDVLTGAIGVAAGENHTCALLATGRVRCWGLGSSGQLGNGATDDQTLPVDVLGMCP